MRACAPLLALALWACAAPGQLPKTGLTVANPKAHTLSTSELWQLAAERGDVILVGRILAPVSKPVTVPDSAATDSLPRLPVQVVTVRIEPMEYLQGGLEGDELEANYRFGALLGRHPASLLESIAGVDTMTAIICLKRVDESWEFLHLVPDMPTREPRSSDEALEAQLRDGFVPVSQRHLKQTVEPVRAWIRTPPDSSHVAR